jgi:hypothetical protein
MICQFVAAFGLDWLLACAIARMKAFNLQSHPIAPCCESCEAALACGQRTSIVSE